VNFDRGSRVAIGNIRSSEKHEAGNLLKLRIVEPIPSVVLRMIVEMLAGVEENDRNTVVREYVLAAACKPFLFILRVGPEIEQRGPDRVKPPQGGCSLPQIQLVQSQSSTS